MVGFRAIPQKNWEGLPGHFSWKELPGELPVLDIAGLAMDLFLEKKGGGITLIRPAQRKFECEENPQREGYCEGAEDPLPPSGSPLTGSGQRLGGLTLLLSLSNSQWSDG